MNQLALLGLFYSKQKMRELAVLIQLLIMAVFFAFSADPFITYFREQAQMDRLYRIRYKDTLYFNAGFNLQMEGTEELRNDVFNRICSVAEGSDVYRFSNLRATYKQNGSHVCNMIIYDRMDNILSLSIKKGMIKKDPGIHYILVTSGIGKYYPVGSEMEIELPDTGITVLCVVSGVLKANGAIPILGSFGSFANPKAFEVSMSRQEPFDAILSFDLGEDTEIKEKISWQPNYMIIPGSGTDTDVLQKKLEEKVEVYGEVLKMNEVVKGSLKAVIIDYAAFVYQLVLYTLVALFGYGGYIFLTIETRKKVFRELHLLGMTGRRVFLLFFISNWLLLLIASALGMLGKFLANGLHPHMQFSLGSWEAFLTLLGMMSGILLLASLIGYRHIRKNTAVDQKEERGA